MTNFRFCPSCGAEAMPNTSFCGGCGRSLEQVAATTSPSPGHQHGTRSRLVRGFGWQVVSPRNTSELSTVDISSSAGAANGHSAVVLIDKAQDCMVVDCIRACRCWVRVVSDLGHADLSRLYQPVICKPPIRTLGSSTRDGNSGMERSPLRSLHGEWSGSSSISTRQGAFT